MLFPLPPTHKCDSGDDSSEIIYRRDPVPGPFDFVSTYVGAIRRGQLQAQPGSDRPAFGGIVRAGAAFFSVLPFLAVFLKISNQLNFIFFYYSHPSALIRACNPQRNPQSQRNPARSARPASKSPTLSLQQLRLQPRQQLPRHHNQARSQQCRQRFHQHRRRQRHQRHRQSRGVRHRATGHRPSGLSG